MDEPQGYVYYGSIVAAPYVGQIFSGAFAAFGVEPDYAENEIPATAEMPGLFGLSLTQAASAVKAAGLQYEFSGEGESVIARLKIAAFRKITRSVARKPAVRRCENAQIGAKSVEDRLYAPLNAARV